MPPLDISAIKSAEIIDDPVQIKARIGERVNASGQVDAWDLSGDVPIARRYSAAVARPHVRAQVDPKTKDVLVPAPQLQAPTAEEIRRLAEARKIEWNDAYAERAIPYWGSDERVDSHGDIVRCNWLFDLFEKNSPMPFCHGWGGLPVGNIIDWKVLQRSDPDYNGPALWLLALFGLAETSTVADGIYRWVRSGMLKAGSVGFTSDVLVDVKDDDERRRLGLGRWGYILDRNHLLEYSPCMLGANSGALVILNRGRDRGILRSQDVLIGREMLRAHTRSADAWRKADADFVAMARMVFRDAPEAFADHKDHEAPFALPEPKAAPILYAPPERRELSADERNAINERFDALESLVATTASGLMERMDEIRTLLETGDVPEESEDSGEDSEDNERSAESKGTSLLATLAAATGTTEEALNAALGCKE